MTERNGTAAAGGLSSNRASARAPAERLTGRPGRVGTFRVWSRTTAGRFYFVAWVGDGGVCGCTGFGYRGRCWHLELVALLVEAEVAA